MSTDRRSTLNSALAGLAALAVGLAAAPAWAAWPNSAGGPDTDTAVAVVTSNIGDTYVVGHFEGTAVFGSFVLNSSGLRDVFVAKINGGGEYVWVAKAGGASDDVPTSITVDAANNVYVGGHFFGVSTFGGTDLTATGPSKDGFIAKLNANGGWAWAYQIAGARGDSVRAVTSIEGDNTVVPPIEGSVFIAGEYYCTAVFNPGSGNAPDGNPLSNGNCFDGAKDLFVARIEHDGDWVWARDRGAAASSREAAVAIDADDNGRLYYAAEFAPGGLVTAFSDNFQDLNQWTKSGNGANAGVLGDPQNRMSGSRMLFVQNGVAVISQAIDLSDFESAVFSMDAFHGGDYQVGGWFDSPQSGLNCAGPVSTVAGLKYYCEIVYSEKPDGNEDLVVEYRDASGTWRPLGKFNGGGTEFAEFDLQGTNALSLPPNALHSAFQLRFFMDAGFTGRTDCVAESPDLVIDLGLFKIRYSPPNTQEFCDIWHVDDVRIEGVGQSRYFVSEISNTLADDPIAPSFSGADLTLPEGYVLTDLARDQAGDRVAISGTNTRAPVFFCGATVATGAFTASLDASGVGLVCDWIRFPGGTGSSGGGGVTLDAAGNVYSIGSFEGTITFDYRENCNGAVLETEALVSNTGGTDVMLTRHTRDGVGCWATGGSEFDGTDSIPARAGGLLQDLGVDLSTDGLSTLYLVGEFTGSAVFGEDTRVNGLGDTDAFIVNWGTDGRPFQVETWPIGVALSPPINAKVDDFTLMPDFAIDGVPVNAIQDKLVYWAYPVSGDARLIPLQPFSNLEVKWRVQGEPPESSARISSIGSANWPAGSCTDDNDEGCFQVHAATAPVEINPASGAFRLLELVVPNLGANDAVVNNGVFSASNSGFASLIYLAGDSVDITQFEASVAVVQTLPFTALPLFVDDAPWEIGTKVVEAYHDEVGRTGYVLNELGYYDGFGTDAAYDRGARSGQIIPVNRISIARPQDAGRELAVAWYRRKSKGVYWPDKAVRYDPQWPLDPDKIIIASQTGGEVLGQQPLDPLLFPSLSLYIQGDRSQPGYNPNDEHAFFAPSTTGTGLEAIFALRSDFGSRLPGDEGAASDPYVLIKYFDDAVLEWKFRVYEVLATGAGFNSFNFTGVAGTTVSPPFPVRQLPGCAESRAVGQGVGEQPPPPFFQDYKNQLWAKSAGSGQVMYFYPLQPGFFYDLNNDDVEDDVDGDGQPDLDTTCVPWLARLSAAEGGTASPVEPIQVGYSISWPAESPQLVIGETLLAPKRGLPDIINQAAIEVVYDDLQATMADPPPGLTLAQMIDPLNPRSVALPEIPEEIASELRTDGKRSILGSADGVIKLPVSVRDRISYDPLNNVLSLIGLFDESGAGEPLLLLNVLSKRDRVVLKKIDGGDGSEEESFTGACASLADDCSWDQAVEALFRLSRNPQGIQRICTNSEIGDQNVRNCLTSDPVTVDDVLIGFQDQNGDFILEPFQAVGVNAALTAGNAQGSGFLTLAFNNDPSLNPLPVSLSIIRVDCLQSPPPPVPPADADVYASYQGQIQVLAPENIFDEQLVLRHSGDFGGNPDALEFEWFFHPDIDGTPPTPLPDPASGQLNGWIKFPTPDPMGAVEISIEGANIQTLSDNWYVARYRGLPACNNATDFGLWAGQPGGTPLDERAQLAEGWVKRVLGRLNPFEARVQNFAQAATNNYASMLIQLGERYEGDIALNNDPDNINSFGLIEAYTTVMRRALALSADSTPPVDYGPANNAILLVASRLVDFYTLLGNEAFADALDPMIGIDTDGGNFSLAPAIFNFQNQVASILEEELVLLRGRDNSQGPVRATPVYNRFFWNFTTGDGEVAYALSYNISDQNDSGVIDEFDARIQFPQGHGDAWGHYLTAMDFYYDLLRHPFFSWVPRAEGITVAGAPLQVDFEDERQFAQTAAAKARVGAEIVDLTYRLGYVEDPMGQFQGYSDPDPQRAWGVSEWARRAGQGAYFDWVTANAILPVEDLDPDHQGIEKIDRTTILELNEIRSEFANVQGQVDKADRGLNPLGLGTGVVPFDIDPSLIDPTIHTDPQTHFEQVYNRAATALDNVVQVWDFANQLTQLMRRNQNEVDDITLDALATETDFSNQLIEIFGYPYADDIGVGGTYPAGYDGPDMYHYMYIDPPALAGTAFDFDCPNPQPDPTDPSGVATICPDGYSTGNRIARINQFTGTFTPVPGGINFFGMTRADSQTALESAFNPFQCDENPLGDGCPLGNLDVSDSLDVTYETIESADFGFAFSKPQSWTGQRRAPGRLQDILTEMLSARIAVRQALIDYDNLRQEIIAQTGTLKDIFNITEQTIQIAQNERETLKNLTIASQALNGAAVVGHRIAALLDASFKNTQECLPKSFVAGLAAGGDLTSGPRCAIAIGGSAAAFAVDTVADVLDIASSATESAKEDVSQQAAVETLINDSSADLYNIKGDLDALFRQEPMLRAEIYARAESAQQLLGAYDAALAEGLRVFDQLVAFRRRGAAAIQEFRYEDMAFRIFRNDALQKYRSSFDHAARMVYLAAAAYDYETNLLGSDAQSGQDFLTGIVRERSIGQIIDGEAVAGSRGLADPMARMLLNFEILKGQMGFNNPQNETNGFSLRRELFRTEDDATWRQILQNARVDDLWALSEFRRFARPFDSEAAGPQPGIVLAFPSVIGSGVNFFGKELGPGDSSYDSSQFSTRIRGVGMGFEGYEGLPLADDPRVYLFPVGADILRAPDPLNFTTREWQILDQVIPLPFPIGAGDLDNFAWLPSLDNVIGTSAQLRRYPRFLAQTAGQPFDGDDTDRAKRLVGRSVWNRKWVLIIPGATLLVDPNEGLDTFIHGEPLGNGERDGNGVSDIFILFTTYAYSGF